MPLRLARTHACMVACLVGAASTVHTMVDGMARVGVCPRAAPSPARIHSTFPTAKVHERAGHRRPAQARHSNMATSQRCVVVQLSMSAHAMPSRRQRAQSGHVAAICRAVPPMQIAKRDDHLQQEPASLWCAPLLIAVCRTIFASEDYRSQDLSGTQSIIAT